MAQACLAVQLEHTFDSRSCTRNNTKLARRKLYPKTTMIPTVKPRKVRVAELTWGPYKRGYLQSAVFIGVFTDGC